MARRKSIKIPDPKCPGNEKQIILVEIKPNQRKNFATALLLYRIANEEVSFRELMVEALEAYYGPQDVRISE